MSVEATRSGHLQANKPRVMEQGSDLSDFYALFGSDRASAKEPCTRGSDCGHQPPNRFPTPADTGDFDFLFRTFNHHAKSHKQQQDYN
jgi:hypothetical protein